MVRSSTPGDEFPQVECSDRAEWRAWLARHHATVPGAWLVYFKKHTGRASITYRESVLEALCFGWIDGLKRRLDDQRYTHRFTPRRPNSRWSDLNVRLAQELIETGLMQPAGLAAFEQRARYAEETRTLRVNPEPELPAELERTLRANPRSWEGFTTLAPGYRRQYVLWLTTAKRAATREKRLQEAIRLLAAGQKLGMR